MWSDEPSGGALLEQDQRSIYQFGCLVCHKPVLWYDFD
jgi:hypothetical protein